MICTAPSPGYGLERIFAATPMGVLTFAQDLDDALAAFTVELEQYTRCCGRTPPRELDSLVLVADSPGSDHAGVSAAPDLPGPADGGMRIWLYSAWPWPPTSPASG